MNKKEFDDILGSVQKKLITDKIKFLNTFAYISPLTNDRKTKMASLMEEKEFTFNQTVYEEGDLNTK